MHEGVVESEEMEEQLEIPEVTKLTDIQKAESYNAQKFRLNEMISLFNANDYELIEAMTGMVAAMLWLKGEHEKEGSISFEYKKKKLVRGALGANVAISAKYRKTLNETDTEILSRAFLDKQFLIG